MNIRKARPEDREPIVDIWLRSVRATHDFLPENTIQLLAQAVCDGALDGLEMWILEADSATPVGFMGLSGNKVEALFLSPDVLRRGGGRQLISHARQLKGPLTVDVNEQNAPARRFYEACGFVVEGQSDLDSMGLPFPLLHLKQG